MNKNHLDFFLTKNAQLHSECEVDLVLRSVSVVCVCFFRENLGHFSLREMELWCKDLLIAETD